MALLEVERLTITYGQSAPSVDQVSFSLGEGEAMGLVGESGCGKSTIGRGLMRLLPSNATMEGSVHIDGELVASYQYGTWRGEKMALIFQDPMTRLNPLLTIEEHAFEVLRSHTKRFRARDARQKLRDSLDLVRIEPERARQYPHEFSGGMRQRVMIALALLLDPVLLIADEPTTSLDVTVANEILQELTYLRQVRQMGLLLISHDLGMVAQYCDRLAVMYDGVLVESGAVKDLFQNPQHPYTQQLLNAALHFRPPVVEDLTIATNDAPLALANTVDLSADGTDRPLEDGASNAAKSSSPVVLLAASGLRKYYTKGNVLGQWLDPNSNLIKAVDNIDLTVYQGDTLGIIGESGSGKSTTGRLLLQLIRPDAGSVHFEGQDLTTLSFTAMKRLRSQMQMIFQDPRAALNPYMTVEESLADPLLIHHHERSFARCLTKVYNILERVGLPSSFAQRYPRDLSGGQLQRVNIARALITNPKLVICDEPVSMLDASIQQQVLELMQQLKDEFQLTYVFITHDLAVAQFFCQNIAVMKQGRIVEYGKASAVLGHPVHEYTQSLIASVPKIPEWEQ
ncbi:MAG: ABC transporter ATP-binding protein [Pseudanabaena sp. ELA607]